MKKVFLMMAGMTASVFAGDVIALYPFIEGNDGENVVQVFNSIDSTHYSSDVAAASRARSEVPAAVPKYSKDVPGQYIFANAAAAEPLFGPGEYQSISSADGLGYVHIADLFSAAAKSASGDFTMEAFVKVTTHDGAWRNFITTEGTYDSADAQYYKLATTEHRNQVVPATVGHARG